MGKIELVEIRQRKKEKKRVTERTVCKMEKEIREKRGIKTKIINKT